MNKPYEWIYKTRGILMLPPSLFILFVFYKETENHLLVWPAGLAIFFAGVAVRVWAQMHLHYRLNIRKKLTITGPYVFVRNPIYIANTAMLLGLVVLSELLWFLPVMALWCAVVYTFVVRREEAHLAEKYGAPYIEYTHNTPRWLPQSPARRSRLENTGRFVLQSLVAEAHCLLWIIPFVAKEFWHAQG